MSLTYPTKVKEFVIDCWFMQGLVEIKKSTIYLLIDRLIWLILTLLVLTATTERVFSIMKIVKIRLYNQMNDFFCRLFDCYIEKKIDIRFTMDMIINDFCFKKDQWA
jgi:hypothetical protein